MFLFWDGWMVEKNETVHGINMYVRTNPERGREYLFLLLCFINLKNVIIYYDKGLQDRHQRKFTLYKKDFVISCNLFREGQQEEKDVIYTLIRSMGISFRKHQRLYSLFSPSSPLRLNLRLPVRASYS